jgi:hypothetical protein
MLFISNIPGSVFDFNLLALASRSAGSANSSYQTEKLRLKLNHLNLKCTGPDLDELILAYLLS